MDEKFAEDISRLISQVVPLGLSKEEMKIWIQNFVLMAVKKEVDNISQEEY